MPTQTTRLKQKAAPWVRLILPALSVVVGLAIWLRVGSFWALVFPFFLFFIGTYLGNQIFDRWASLDQKKEDIRYRIDTE
ncbi:hypothetical protein [Sneathiella glossodoripedis]|uniref:hypothetical protein n=1 Tax=Sneathiella glossodoripedis TaxID=418853 RepID=UPI000470AB01|nr:hypothetical protein [Sneathiella glossodoripedis]